MAPPTIPPDSPVSRRIPVEMPATWSALFRTMRPGFPKIPSSQAWMDGTNMTSRTRPWNLVRLHQWWEIITASGMNTLS